MNLEGLTKSWGWIAFRGIAAILFGILTFFMPGITLAVLVIWFGAFALVDGIFNVVAAFKGRGQGEAPWWALVLSGLVGIGTGLVTFFVPGLTALALLALIAAWALVTGVFEIIAAIRLRKQIKGEGWLILNGVLSLVFSGLLMLFPGPGALALVLWVGAYAVVAGVLLLALAFRLRSERKGHVPGAETAQPGPRPA
jgi:uncharacterized membrane protein HdeD (DUF308 family)